MEPLLIFLSSPSPVSMKTELKLSASEMLDGEELSSMKRGK